MERSKLIKLSVWWRNFSLHLTEHHWYTCGSLLVYRGNTTIWTSTHLSCLDIQTLHASPGLKYYSPHLWSICINIVHAYLLLYIVHTHCHHTTGISVYSLPMYINCQCIERTCHKGSIYVTHSLSFKLNYFRRPKTCLSHRHHAGNTSSAN